MDYVFHCVSKLLSSKVYLTLFVGIYIKNMESKQCILHDVSNMYYYLYEINGVPINEPRAQIKKPLMYQGMYISASDY